MTDLVPIIVLMLISIACVLASYRVGIIEGIRRRNAQDVEIYIKNFWPDQWAAYHRGVKEGYASGLADADLFPPAQIEWKHDEPA